MEFYEKIVKVQTELKAPKGQYNSFGKYKYRSCEDIVESVKPLLNQVGLFLTLNDEIVLIGDRYYIKATATISDGKNSVSTTAYARESNELKGMVDSQLTGATSSYARKYALNGLFAIDDTKDADTNEFANEKAAKVDPKEKDKEDSAMKEKLIKELESYNTDLEKVAAYFKKDSVEDLTIADLTKAVVNKRKQNA